MSDVEDIRVILTIHSSGRARELGTANIIKQIIKKYSFHICFRLQSVPESLKSAQIIMLKKQDKPAG